MQFLFSDDFRKLLKSQKNVILEILEFTKNGKQSRNTTIASRDLEWWLDLFSCKYGYSRQQQKELDKYDYALVVGAAILRINPKIKKKNLKKMLCADFDLFPNHPKTKSLWRNIVRKSEKDMVLVHVKFKNGPPATLNQFFQYDGQRTWSDLFLTPDGVFLQVGIKKP